MPPRASWLRRRVLMPLLGLLQQGLSPTQLALTVALGVVFGLIPILGVTTLLATFTAVRLRLNVAAMLLISHLMSPVAAADSYSAASARRAQQLAMARILN